MCYLMKLFTALRIYGSEQIPKNCQFYTNRGALDKLLYFSQKAIYSYSK